MDKEYWLIKKTKTSSEEIIDHTLRNTPNEAIKIFEDRNDIQELSKTSEIAIAETKIIYKSWKKN